MTSLAEIENQAGIARITAGWKKPGLPLDDVLGYWRDVHSPAIARRAGIYDYRHFQYAAVRADLFAPVGGIELNCPIGQQLMWTSDVRYRDGAALDAFNASPPSDVKPHLLGDIELIVNQSTTYKVVGENAKTFLDRTGTAMPQGKPKYPTFELFVRQRRDEASFRLALKRLVEAWTSQPDVLRVRLSLFDVPDMEAERKSGYPIKTHPVERQYQAMLDLSMTDEGSAKMLLAAIPNLGDEVKEIHAYPVVGIYTSNYAGRPTLVGLRGWPAYEALTRLGGYNQAEPGLLEWMYGPVAQGVMLERSR